MPNYCVATNCGSRSDKNSELSYFSFPKNIDIRNRWSEILGISNLDTLVQNKKRLLVCSRHFHDDDYFHFGKKTRILKKGRFPTPTTLLDKTSPTSTEEPVETVNRESKPSTSHPEQSTSAPHTRRRLPYLHTGTNHFCVEEIMNSKEKMLYYTGISTFDIYLALFCFVLKSEKRSEGIRFNKPSKNSKYVTHKLSPLNEMCLTLVRLRRGTDLITLGRFFGVSGSTASRIFTAWINLLYTRLSKCSIFPSNKTIMGLVPERLKRKYENLIGCVFCTEFEIKKPSSLLTTTLKALLMIDPNGDVMFVSSLFKGSISGCQILEKSRFVELLRRKVQRGNLDVGDVILADKAFNVRDLLSDGAVNINVPTFRITGQRFTTDKVLQIQYIARERVLRRVKSFKVLHKKFPIAMLGLFNRIFKVCVLLTNFRAPLIKKRNSDGDIENNE